MKNLHVVSDRARQRKEMGDNIYWVSIYSEKIP
jgi:hypothetical protein